MNFNYSLAWKICLVIATISFMIPASFGFLYGFGAISVEVHDWVFNTSGGTLGLIFVISGFFGLIFWGKS